MRTLIVLMLLLSLCVSSINLKAQSTKYSRQQIQVPAKKAKLTYEEKMVVLFKQIVGCRGDGVCRREMNFASLTKWLTNTYDRPFDRLGLTTLNFSDFMK